MLVCLGLVPKNAPGFECNPSSWSAQDRSGASRCLRYELSQFLSVYILFSKNSQLPALWRTIKPLLSRRFSKTNRSFLRIQSFRPTFGEASYFFRSVCFIFFVFVRPLHLTVCSAIERRQDEFTRGKYVIGLEV